MNNSEKVSKLLDDIMIINGVFDYEKAMNTIKKLKSDGDIDVIGYLNLIDACNHYNNDRHYKNSLIYKRATDD